MRLSSLHASSGPTTALQERLQSLLPALAASNAELEDLARSGDLQGRRLEDVDEDDGQYVQMELGLGVLEEKIKGGKGAEGEGEHGGGAMEEPGDLLRLLRGEESDDESSDSEEESEEESSEGSEESVGEDEDAVSVTGYRVVEGNTLAEVKGRPRKRSRDDESDAIADLTGVASGSKARKGRIEIVDESRH